jgi:hypothetical protein
MVVNSATQSEWNHAGPWRSLRSPAIHAPVSRRWFATPLISDIGPGSGSGRYED